MKMDTGDTSFLLFSCALVFLMTPGLALFYGGMVRKKNILNTIMMSFIILGIVTVQWFLLGYTFSFGKDINGLIGSFNWFALLGVGMEPNGDFAATIPHGIFMVFQMMFALIAAAIISGAVVERMRFPAYVLFTLLWTTLVYDPLAHWVWAPGGWLRNLGALDFAGGTVVHISSGVSALVLAIMLGKRKKSSTELLVPHNLPMTVLGATLLWFGWFGFNAGSALSASGLAANAFITTQIAAGAATISWVAVETIRYRKPTLLGAVSGCIAGLVAITPACGFVTPFSAVLIGLLVSPICYYAVSVLKVKVGYDDALDAFGIHGVGGTFGALATGIFASKAVNEAGNNGLLFGNPYQLYVQFISILVSWILAAAISYLIYKFINYFMPVRVSDEAEIAGLDFTQHGENGYATSEMVVAQINTSKPLASKAKIDLPQVDLKEDIQVMSKIDAIIRPDKLDEVKNALKEFGIHGMTVSNVIGCGSQQGQTEIYRGNEYNITLIPKIKIEIVIRDKYVERVVDIIARNSRTGEIGDGKIFVYPIQNSVRIRTNEQGEIAI